MKYLVVLLSLAACGDQIKLADGVKCSDDSACKLLDVQGTCQATGFCSYPDDSCAGGQRYAPGATGMQNACVGGLTCAIEDPACTCGGADEPCCEGTCGTGLTCSGTTCKAGVNQVALGHEAVCVLRTDGHVLCWGSDRFPFAQNNPGAGVEAAPYAPHVIAIDNVAELRRGDGHACVRKTDGTVWCWGHNERGQLGNGTTTNSVSPVQIPGLVATQISTGRMHSCAVGTLAAVTGIYCWGRNGNRSNAGTGRLGNGTEMDSHAPSAVDMSAMAASGQTVKQVVASMYHSCAVMSDDAVWCWGTGGDGQLGDNTATSSSIPVKVNVSALTIGSGVTVSEIALCGRRDNEGGASCMLLSDGNIACWGSGNAGELGTGSSSGELQPTAYVVRTALGAATFTSVVSNGDGFCGLDSAGKVWCWGDQFRGAVGNGLDTSTDVPTPSEVMGLPGGITAIAGGHRAACALDAAKHMWCWGNNRAGQLTRAQAPTTDDESRLVVAKDVTP